MPPLVAAILVGLLYVLHQDLWFWRTAHPLVLGVLPIGLFYHAAFTLATAALMWLLVAKLWPAHLESTPGSTSEQKLGSASRPPTTPPETVESGKR